MQSFPLSPPDGPSYYDPRLQGWQRATPSTLDALCTRLSQAGEFGFGVPNPLDIWAGDDGGQGHLALIQSILETYRRAALGAHLDLLAAQSGLHPNTYAWGLRATLDAYRGPALENWLRRDLPHLFHDSQGGGATYRYFPARLLHIQSSNVGAPGLESLIAACLLGLPMLAKVPSGQWAQSLLFLKIVEKEAPHLAQRMALLAFKGGDAALEAPALAFCETLLIHGSDETVCDIRNRAPAGTRLVQHGHRLSTVYLDAMPDDAALASLAQDIGAYDQMGCLSPRLIFLKGDAQRAETFAKALKTALEAWGNAYPRASLPPEVASAHVQLSARLIFTGKVFKGGDCVVAVDRGPLQFSPVGRFILVRAVEDGQGAYEALRAHQSHLQSLALYGKNASDFRRLVAQFMGLKLPVMTRLGEMQRPPAGWPGDGRLLLQDLLRLGLSY